MFLIFGIVTRTEPLPQPVSGRCPYCGSFTGISVFMTYRCLELFFIPTIRWGYRYFARLDCCGRTAELPRETGERLRRGLPADIDPGIFPPEGGIKTCPGCGYQTTEDFLYCPKCGRRM